MAAPISAAVKKSKIMSPKYAQTSDNIVIKTTVKSFSFSIRHLLNYCHYYVPGPFAIQVIVIVPKFNMTVSIEDTVILKGSGKERFSVSGCKNAGMLFAYEKEC